MLGLLLASLSDPAAAQEAPATLTGTVSILSAAADSPPSRQGVTVELIAHTDESKLTRLTDHYGRFRFDEVPPGRYDMVGRQRGGYGATRLIELRPGQRAECRLRLATRPIAWALTIFWVVLAALLTGSFAAAMMLYGPSRHRRDSSAPRSLTIAILVWLGAFLLFSALAPDMQPCMLEVADPLSSLLAVVLASCVVVVAVLLQPPWPAALGAVVAGLLLTVSSAAAVADGPLVYAGIGIGLLVWTTAAGWLLATLLKRRSYVVLTAWVIAAIDCFQVFYGSTGRVVGGEGAGFEFVRAIGLLPWPLIGSDLIVPRVGYADFLFLAWFLGAALRFELGLVRNYWALLAAFTIGIAMTQVLSLTVGLAVGLPALPFMSALFLLANHKELALEPADKRQVTRFVAVLCGVLVVAGAVVQRRAGTEREDIVLSSAPAGRGAVRPPWDWAALAAPPAVRELSREAVEGGRELRQLEFVAASVAGRAVVVRGWLALPESRPAPAVLQLPGLRRGADRDGCLDLATQGFVALSLDLCPEPGPVPDSDLSAWPASDYEVTPTVERSRLYHAGVAALRGVAVLAASDDVRGGIGVQGDGWGGLLAMACGVVAAPVSAVVATNLGTVGGDSGLVGRELAQRSALTIDHWTAAFAPERYALALRKPFLLVASSNDSYFSLPGAVRLAGLVPAAPKQFVIEPNADHALDGGYAQTPAAWFAMALRDGVPPPPKPELIASATGQRLTFQVRGLGDPRPLFAPAQPSAAPQGPSGVLASDVTLYVSVGPRGWPGRFWTALACQPEPEGWTASCEIAGNGTELSVIVDAERRADLRSALFRTYSIDELQLALRPASPAWDIGWPPQPGRIWRSGADERCGDAGAQGEPLAVILDGEQQLRLGGYGPGVRPYVFRTNDVDALRQLGPQAEFLEVVIEDVVQGPMVAEVIERAGQADERRHAITASRGAVPVAGRHFYTFPLLPLQKPGPGQVGDWRDVDTLQLRFQAAAPDGAAITAVRLTGMPSGEVRPVGRAAVR